MSAPRTILLKLALRAAERGDAEGAAEALRGVIAMHDDERVPAGELRAVGKTELARMLACSPVSHVSGVQVPRPHWPGVPPPHVAMPVQPPGLPPGPPVLSQSSKLPQPSSVIPQVTPLALHVVGTHAQTLGTFAPHTSCGPEHDPHATVPPQPSGKVPQFLPWSPHVAFGHAHW